MGIKKPDARIFQMGGVYEIFQSREIRGIDFDSIKTLTMKVRLTKEYNKDEEISIEIYDREKDEFLKYK